ncbi:MAG: tRNA epoxyqueuosine(34) reductase QueG [Muribaculaceae bacterium]|nr:tRNA epoxyqueuosine(34) reductase QueG [Muribaculaceae bacterium]
MPSSPNIASAIKEQASILGFDACGFARAEEVDAQARQEYRQWLADGRNGCMNWAERYCDVRDNPQLLLDSARTIIMLAMNYYPQVKQSADAPQFAYYAYGRDYHEVMREHMHELAAFIQNETGACCRCCVDTAPLRERYWAQRAGIGFLGMNNQLILPGKGSYFFLGAIITTLELPCDEPCTLSCGECRACIAACPSCALDEGGVDARRCLSCLTIEQRGELPQWVNTVIGNRVYGCDSCQLCCPHNSSPKPTAIQDFHPSAEFMSLTAATIQSMTDIDFKRVFGHSAVRRTRLEGLKRNASLLKN